MASPLRVVRDAKTVDVTAAFRIIDDQLATMATGNGTTARSTIRPVVQLIGIEAQVVGLDEGLQVVKLAVEAVFICMLIASRAQGAQANVRIIGGVLTFAAKVVQTQLKLKYKHLQS